MWNAISNFVNIPFQLASLDYQREQLAQQDAHTAQQIQLQKDFAQNSLQWKVADARKAGINPYYALGASGMSYQPVADYGSDFGQAIANAGQSISGSLNAGFSSYLESKILKEQQKGLELDNQGKQIDNMIKLQQVDQNAGLFNFAPNPDRKDRYYAGFTDRGKSLEELFSEADGWYGTLRNLKLARAMYEDAKVEAKRKNMYAGFDTNVGFSYLTKNPKDLGIPPVLTPVEIEKFERVAKNLVAQGANVAEVALEIVGLLQSIGSKIPAGFLNFLK